LKLCPEPMIRRADPLDRPYAVPRMCAIAKSQSSAEEPLYGLWGTGRLFGRNRRVSGRAAVSAEATPDCMVRPCVARGFLELASAVLHQCIRPLIGALLPAIMDISARATSLADRPQRAKWVTSARLHLVSSSRRPRWVEA